MDELVTRVRAAKENKEVVSIAYIGNVVEIWERFDQEDFPEIKGTYKVRPILSQPDYCTTNVTIKTLPSESLHLLKIGAELGESDFLESEQAFNSQEFIDFLIPKLKLEHDIVPEQSLVSIGVMPWDLFQMIEHKAVDLDVSPEGDGLPIVMIQTSRPKAKSIQKRLNTSGGLTSIGFLKGLDDGSEQAFDVGVFCTDDGVFHIFGEYNDKDPVHMRAKDKWEKRVQQTKGQCALVITGGVTGGARGNPRPKDIVAIVGAQSLGDNLFGLNPLKLSPYG